METGLLIFAVVMACIAAAIVVWCVVAEVDEGSRIRALGWERGHLASHLPHHSQN